MNEPWSKFTGLPLQVEDVDGRNWRLIRAVAYKTDAGETVEIPVAFVTDFASIPRIFWPILPPAGDAGDPYDLAAVPHDRLYSHRKIRRADGTERAITRAEADALFHEILLYVGVTRWKAWVMYHAVRAFGWTVWNRRTVFE